MANDPDIGQNGLVEFQLNTFGNIFIIGPISGEIRRVGVLDYEDIKEYEVNTLYLSLWKHTSCCSNLC